MGDASKGFYFAVHDAAGALINEIDFEYEKRLVMEEEKQKATLGDAIHHFPEYYPPFYSFEVFDDKILAYTYPVTEPPEVTIIDLGGKQVDWQAMKLR